MTKEQEEIIALRAQINSWKPKQRSTPARTAKATETTTPGKKTFKGKHAWRSVPPKAGEPHKKTVDGEEWMYCKFHKYWAKHTSEECCLNPQNKDKTHQHDKDKEPEIDLAAAMASVGVEEVDDKDEE